MLAVLEAAPQNAPLKVAQKRTVRPLTLEAFRRKYADREDGFKYEFNNGAIEKTPSAMKVKQLHILRNLRLHFLKTRAFQNGDMFETEIEQLTSPFQMRRPDMALVPSSKIKTGDESVSNFVVEIISPTDEFRRVNIKLREYFQAGVQVVWHIFPEDEQVYVYTSPTKVTICEGETICSGSPALADFEIAAAAIFVK